MKNGEEKKFDPNRQQQGEQVEQGESEDISEEEQGENDEDISEGEQGDKKDESKREGEGGPEGGPLIRFDEDDADGNNVVDATMTTEFDSTDKDARQLFKFNGKDFAIWKAQVEKVIIAKGAKIALTGPGDGPQTRDATEKFLKYDAWAQSLIITSVSNDQARSLLKCATAQAMWEKLVLLNESKTTSSALMLQQKFYELRMEPNESVQAYVARGEYIQGQLEDVGIKTVDDKTLSDKIVMGLPKRYMNFISHWMSVSDNDEKTVSKMLPKLLAEEEMMNKFNPSNSKRNDREPSSQAMTSERKQGGRKNPDKSVQSRQRQGQRRGRGRGGARGRGNRPPLDQCALCKEKGHWKKDCPKAKSDKQSTSSAHQTSDAIVADSCGTSASNIAFDEGASSEWLLDSGASEHMTYDRNEFVKYHLLDEPIMVRFGNNHEEKAIGKGDILVRAVISEGVVKPLLIKNALHIPRIKRKLISVSAATKLGCTGTIEADKIVIRHGSNIRLVATRQGNLYQAQLLSHPEANAVDQADLLSLWHERMAHVNKRTIVRMAETDALEGLPGFQKTDISTDQVHDKIDCIPCVKGKQARKHFPRSSRRLADQVGQRVHVDVCGPIGTESLGKNKYFVLFKDEHTNYRHVQFIKGKDQVYDCVRKYLADFESETKRKVLKLVSDNGSEFTSNRMKEFLLSRGIAQEFSAPFTPQQNGYIERDNRTVMEAARSMLYNKSLPEKFWGEATRTAVYTINRTVNERNNKVTPFEIYHGHKPRVSHMKVFGSFAMVKEQEKKRSGYQRKLEPRAKCMMLVGYERDFTYRLYEPEKNLVIISREVIFDETKTLDSLRDKSAKYEYLDALIDAFPKDDDQDNGISNDDSPNDHDHDKNDAVEHHDSDSSEQEGEEEEDSFKSINDDVDLTPEASGLAREGTTAPHGYNLRSKGNLAEANAAFDGEPASYRQAITSDDSDQWKAAMEDEYASLLRNETWDLVNLPPGRRAIKCKWVFKIKRRTSGEIERYKARLVACGYSQKAGIDYQETFSPVVRLDSVRVLLALVAKYDLELMHFDVKTAFLNGHLTESIYMQQPEGFRRDNDKVCKLKRSLYGLKQASKVWNDCFVDFLKKFELEPLTKDTCILVRKSKQDNKRLIIAIYVDDGLACSDDKALLKQVVKHLSERFEITVMEAKCFVGLQIQRDRSRRQLFINQEYYIEQIVKTYNLEQSKDVTTPLDYNQKLCKSGTTDGKDHEQIEVPYRELVGSLMYAMLGTRPDISFAVNVLARYSEEPRKAHWQAAKRVVQYLKTNKSLGIKFEGNKPLTSYTDADYAADVDTRKSTSGCLILLSGGPIMWKTNKQGTVATSTTEAEFIAACLCAKETLWAKQLLVELGEKETPTDLYIDNQGAIRVILNNQVHPKTKHIDIKYMFLRDIVKSKQINPLYVTSEHQLADILTKQSPRGTFIKLREGIAMQSLTKAVCAFALVVSLSQAKQVTGPPQELHSVMLTVQSPCDDLEVAHEVSDSTWDKQRAAKQTFNTHTHNICDYRYKRILEEIEKSLESCVKSVRTKRQAAAVMAVVKRMAAYGLTNFLKSELRQGAQAMFVEVLREELAKLVSQRTKSLLSNTSERGPLEIQDVSAASETARNHEVELALANSQVSSRMPWASFHTLREMIAGLANFMTIARVCRSNRQLATHELGELLGSLTFAQEYPQRETFIQEINIDRVNNTFEFVFTTGKGHQHKFDIPLEHAKYAYIGGFVLLVTFAGALLCISARRSGCCETTCCGKLFCCYRRRREPVPQKAREIPLTPLPKTKRPRVAVTEQVKSASHAHLTSTDEGYNPATSDFAQLTNAKWVRQERLI